MLDVCISRKYERDLQNDGFQISHVDNLQGRAGWITGWVVPHSKKDVKLVVKWLCKAFEQNL